MGSGTLKTEQVEQEKAAIVRPWLQSFPCLLNYGTFEVCFKCGRGQNGS